MGVRNELTSDDVPNLLIGMGEAECGRRCVLEAMLDVSDKVSIRYAEIANEKT